MSVLWRVCWWFVTAPAHTLLKTDTYYTKDTICTPPAHTLLKTDTHYTKDTICCICKKL